MLRRLNSRNRLNRIEFSRLLQQLKNGRFEYLDQLQFAQDSKWWADIRYEEDLHRNIIHQLVRHLKFDALELSENLSFNFHLVHWTFVLLEAIFFDNLEIKKMAMRHMKIQLPMQRQIIIRIVKVLILNCEPSDVISFFDHCKAVGNETYICFRGEFLKDLRVWDEDSLPLSSRDFIIKFNEKWKRDPKSIEYVNKMYREEKDYELTFMEVFSNLNEEIRERKTSAHAEYVIAEMVLEDKVLKDILKHIVQPYL